MSVYLCKPGIQKDKIKYKPAIHIYHISFTHTQHLRSYHRSGPVMDLVWIFCDGNPQLFYQFMNIPFAFLFCCLARQGHLSLINRYIYLTLGGFILAIVTMGPYSLLLFFSAVLLLLLIQCLHPMHIHQWTLGLQMCWQTCWHLYIQYQLYWLQETPDSRLLLAISALMLMTQRVSSLSLDLQEGTLTSPFQNSSQDQYVLIPFLSYSLYFPALLGGPLCSFKTYVESVRQMSVTPPFASYLGNLTLKILQVVVLVWIKYPLKKLLTSLLTFRNSTYVCQDILWIWILSLLLKMNYYAHWKISECVNSAAGIGLHGYGHSGKTSCDGLSDGSPWVTEASSRPSVFARQWNRTTAAWLRRMVFKRSNKSPLFMTFGFSAWWHGLHPGQILGFLIWAFTVQGDYKLHHFLHPKLTSLWRKWLYVSLNWAFTQLTISCVVVCVEFQSLASVKLLWSSYITVFPLLSILMNLIL
ncbi:ghrelin O-acyltransferase [Ctenopharyngodon idella]|uniref:ghrelin O-acyltransferase n=1 Tax=Ctenopharyngodon idella TaxID=7959 RepID=UPI00222E919B|nr:ghrelin O-acyltransferase [Ctenopharyngodon idella]